MFFYLFIPIAHSVLRTPTQQLLDEEFAVLLAVSWILDTGVDYLLVDCEGVVRVLAEGQFAA